MKFIFSQNSKQIELPLQLVTYQNKFSFIDLFAGIGGFRIALQKLGGQCLGYSEIDKQAIDVYQQNFISYLNKDEIELGDITKITELPSHVDIVVSGVPCQPWSVAGRLKGFEDKRGKLWFDAEKCQEYKFPIPLNIHPKIFDILDDIKSAKVIEKVKLDQYTLFKGMIPPSRTRFQKDDELNDFFIFSDLRNGHTTIHSWDIIETSDREKMICLTLLKHRRSKKYGEKDGNPLSFDNFKQIISDTEINELNQLVQKGIFRLTADNKYEFVNSKNMTGINDIYRIILPTADIMPTLTATGAKDYIATVSIHASDPDKYKNIFLEKIYKQKNFIPIMAKHACKLQGFPTNFEYQEKDDVARKQFGNAVPVPVVEYVAKELLSILDI